MTTLTEQNKVYLLGVFSLILGITSVFLFYKQGLGLNYPLFLVLAVGFGLLLSRLFSRHLDPDLYATITAGLFFSGMVFVRGSELLTFFNIIGSALLLLIAILISTGTRLRSFVAVDYLGISLLPFRFIEPFFKTFTGMVSFKNDTDESAKTREILSGGFMALIAVTIFARLFASADAGFAKLLSNIFTFTIDQDFVNRIFLGALVAAFFVGAFGFMFKKLHANTAPAPKENSHRLGSIETMIVFSAINVLFFVFIILQVSYLFGGAAHLLAQGLTYAEYAREGFFQLIVVAMLSYVIISAAEGQIVRNNGVHIRSFQILSGVLVLQVIVILISAFTRLSLYEDAYGFTTIRLYSHAFMIWLGFALALLAIHVGKNGTREGLSFRTFVAIVLLLFGMNIINPDAFIAKKNLERYQTTGLLDANYLGSLSDDALPYTIRLLDDPNEEVRRSFAQGLYWGNHYCDPDDCTDGAPQHSWRSARLNHTNAAKLLAPKQSVLQENKAWRDDHTIDNGY